MGSRGAALFLCAACALIAAPAVAQTVSKSPLATPAAPAEGYRDRLIEGGNLALDLFDDFDPGYERDGWPRSIRVEGVLTSLKRNGSNFRESGISLGGFVETPQYGSITLDANLGAGNGTATLWQRNVPFDGGWRAHNGLGVISSPNIDLARQQYRFFLPSWPMAGVATEWRGPDGFQFTGGAGAPGVLDGIRLPGFDRVGGRTATAGAQWSGWPGATAGAQWVEAHDVRSDLSSNDPDAARFSSRSLFLAAAAAPGRARIQGNLVASDSIERGFGGWVDVQLPDGRVLHSLGAFYLDPGLVWGNQPLIDDAQGGYYRFNYQSRQWLFDGGVDRVISISGRTPTTTFLTGSLRHQRSRDIGLGAGGNLRHNGGNAWSAFGFVDRAFDWATARFQLDVAEDTNRRDMQLTADQTWPTQAGTRLATSLIVGSTRDSVGRTERIGASVYGGGDLTPRVTVDGNLRLIHNRGAAHGTSTLANVSLQWRLATHWSLIGTLYENRSQTVFPLRVLSPISQSPLPQVDTFRDRGIFLALRFEKRAGMAMAPLGGAPGQGAGRIVGTVYLDANDDNRFDATEVGARDLTVILDGRFVTRTDAQGRFEFPAVVAGSHVISVMPDNLPLPWTLTSQGRFEIEVSVRGTTTVEVAAKRTR